MKLTKKQLKRIIKEELENTLKEYKEETRFGKFVQGAGRLGREFGVPGTGGEEAAMALRRVRGFAEDMVHVVRGLPQHLLPGQPARRSWDLQMESQLKWLYALTDRIDAELVKMPAVVEDALYSVLNIYKEWNEASEEDKDKYREGYAEGFQSILRMVKDEV